PTRSMHRFHTETRFVTARDGTRLSWHFHESVAYGASPQGLDPAQPTLLLTNGIGSSRVFWTHLVHALGRDYQVVHWDYRAHGGSERAVGGDYAITTQRDDLRR